jgi:hypothetical protein
MRLGNDKGEGRFAGSLPLCGLHTPTRLREGDPYCGCRNVCTRIRHWGDDQLDVLLCQDQRRGRERHSANRLLLPHNLPAKHHRWREKRNEDCRGCRFGDLPSVSTHIAEKVSHQSGFCHCGILARFSSHSETRLPLDLCRRAELKAGATEAFDCGCKSRMGASVARKELEQACPNRTL